MHPAAAALEGALPARTVLLAGRVVADRRCFACCGRYARALRRLPACPSASTASDEPVERNHEGQRAENSAADANEQRGRVHCTLAVRDEAIAAEAVRSLASHQYSCAAEGPAVQDTRSLQRKPVAVRRVGVSRPFSSEPPQLRNLLDA
jgi:hypothetical protein